MHAVKLDLSYRNVTLFAPVSLANFPMINDITSFICADRIYSAHARAHIYDFFGFTAREFVVPDRVLPTRTIVFAYQGLIKVSQ